MYQTIKTRSGRELILPTDAEDAAINAGIAADPDTFQPTDDQLRQFRQAKPGRPPMDKPKEKITIRLSPETLEAFRRTGAGWQTRVDAALREWLEQHPDCI